MRITVLAGGVGSARLLAGLVRVTDPTELTVVVNVGDDERMRGLHVSPDVDTVLYHLAGLEDWERGWGTTGESYAVQERYAELAAKAGQTATDLQDWFTLGDRDLATNLLRTRMLDAGRTLSEATDALRRALGVECLVVPATDDPLRTVLRTADGHELDFQEYFVHRRQEPEIEGVFFRGDATAAPGVVDAIATADVVLIPPSNPVLSVEPVLHVAGVREALRTVRGTRVAVSPIVGGRALKGPADRIMRALGHEVSPAGVARVYRDLIDVFVIDEQDALHAPAVESDVLRTVVCDTIMRSPEDAARLCKTVLDAVG
jgi:LPPG:FO 2-phospho-L-lactate transferase